MIIVTPTRAVITSPIKADELFPAVCRDKEFSYGDTSQPSTQLKALKDAELAFSLYRSCNYQIPSNFDAGIQKISAIVGSEITAWNAKRMRKQFEGKLVRTPQSTRPSLLRRARDTAAKFFM